MGINLRLRGRPVSLYETDRFKHAAFRTHLYLKAGVVRF